MGFQLGIRWPLAAVIATTVVVVLGACTLEPKQECYGGDYRRCACDDASSGYERCSDDGSGYGACDCSGFVPGLVVLGDGGGAGTGSGNDSGAAGPDTSEAGSPALLPFLASCTSDAECETGLCYTFSAKGSFCSMVCRTAADCPAPSTGCNNQTPRVCKVP
jgi:hypothetical protein